MCQDWRSSGYEDNVVSLHHLYPRITLWMLNLIYVEPRGDSSYCHVFTVTRIPECTSLWLRETFFCSKTPVLTDLSMTASLTAVPQTAYKKIHPRVMQLTMHLSQCVLCMLIPRDDILWVFISWSQLPVGPHVCQAHTGVTVANNLSYCHDNIMKWQQQSAGGHKPTDNNSQTLH